MNPSDEMRSLEAENPFLARALSELAKMTLLLEKEIGKLAVAMGSLNRLQELSDQRLARVIGQVSSLRESPNPE